jgi:hypothetical protein
LLAEVFAAIVLATVRSIRWRKAFGVRGRRIRRGDISSKWRRAFGAFARFVQDPDTAIRAGVADVLGLAGDLAALPLVESLLRDRDLSRSSWQPNALSRAAGDPAGGLTTSNHHDDQRRGR